MSRETNITARGANGSPSSVKILHPEDCPRCHRGQIPNYLEISFVDSTSKTGELLRLQNVYRCNYADCEALFIAYYLYNPDNGTSRFMASLPTTSIGRDWGKSINKISPDFVEIYTQADKAETDGLDKITGPGYRKSLEFLIKDWLVYMLPDKAEEILAKKLGACINEYIDEKHIQDVASRASWLGNDETHYTRIWSDKDVSDLKLLIDATASMINMRELAAKAVEDMPKRKFKKSDN
jgi:hypothetical protein